MRTSEALQARAARSDALFDRILVPLDGSGAAESVLPVVRALCRRPGTTAILARIIDPAASSDPDQPQFARVYLKQAAGDLPSKPIVRVGPVAETLLAVAAEEGASLIVMATRGRFTPDSAPWGGVADQLLRSSSLPILAVPPHARPDDPAPFRTILVAGGDVAAAVEFAVSFGADLAVLLRSVPAGSTGRAEAEIRIEAEEALARLSRPFDLKRIPTVRVIHEGDPVAAVLAVARDYRADVIALGGAIEGVLRASTTPVLVQT